MADNAGAHLKETIDREIARSARRHADLQARLIGYEIAVAGIAHRLAPLIPAPMVDGVGCAVGQAEYLVRLGLRHGHPARKLKAESDFSGVSAELVSRLAGR
jgi:hypothetical protein